MLEGVVTIILSAIMTALGFLVVRWLTSVDQKLQELEEGMREAKDQCKSAYSDFVSRGDFAAAMKNSMQPIVVEGCQQIDWIEISLIQLDKIVY